MIDWVRTMILEPPRRAGHNHVQHHEDQKRLSGLLRHVLRRSPAHTQTLSQDSDDGPPMSPRTAKRFAWLKQTRRPGAFGASSHACTSVVGRMPGCLDASAVASSGGAAAASCAWNASF